MSDSLETRRKFLIADSHEEARKLLAKNIEAHISNSVFIFASDGSDALMKLNNDLAHVLLIDQGVSKITCHTLVETLLNDKKFENIAIIIMSEVPEQDLFIEAVGMGRVQFLDRPDDEQKLIKTLTRALNFIAIKDKSEFHMRFLVNGDTLIKEGDKADNVYLVKKGTLKASVLRENKEVIYGEILPGEFVGEMAYINGEARIADVVALSDCELIEIPIDYLDHLLFQKPVWSRALLKTLSKRIKVSNTTKAD